VQETRWWPAHGTVSRAFDDVLVPGTTVLPGRRVDELAPWPLDQARAYQQEFLAGHFALRYDVEPENGYAEARDRMAPIIRSDCEDDIGGDEQRVHNVDTQYNDVTFKLMLLPIWIATFLYGGKTFQILVNGLTGEVRGERPYSKLKIFFAVLAALIVIAVIVALVAVAHGHGHTSTRVRTHT
jgi:hypothetical protein